jgi:hypothetical protein
VLEQSNKRFAPWVTCRAELLKRSEVPSRVFVPSPGITPPYGISLRGNVARELVDNGFQIGHFHTPDAMFLIAESPN